MKNLTLITNLKRSEDRPFEIVERKGIGHPDTLSDGVAEAVSIAFSDYCLKKYGAVLHQTLDKIMFMGGHGKFGYGIGEMTKPWRLLLNGRISKQFAQEKIPFREIEIEAAKNYLKKVVPRFDSDKWLKVEFETTSFSKNPHWFAPRGIEDVPDAIHPYANDTSTCAGYWPLSITERLALLLEGYFYHFNGLPRFSFVGQDIKVMCMRKNNTIDITICVPFFAQDILNSENYYERKAQIVNGLTRVAEEFVDGKYKINLFVNTQDDMAKTNSKSVGHYFVISGSALDSGEEGVVGRGNRSRGVISSIRPVNMEAVQGKNPVYYIGKVYTYLADYLAKALAEELETEANVYLSSRNSDDIHIPHGVFVELTQKRSQKDVSRIIEREMSRVNWVKDIVENKVFLPFPGSGNGYQSKFQKRK